MLWARAESIEALVSSFVAIATLLRLPEREAREQNITIQAVKTWLQTHRSWLLILDNADEMSLLPAFLPPSVGGHLLLTTRASATGRLAHRLEIETLAPEQGTLFLLRWAGLLTPNATQEEASSLDWNVAMQVCLALGGLPLALDQAGAYLEETGMSLVTYQQMYHKRRADLFKQRGGLVADHPEPVATTWSLSFQKVQEQQPAAAELLRLCAFLAPDAITEDILTVGASYLGPILSPVAVDVFLLSQAIEALRAYSLVRRDPQGKGFSIHRLVQAVLQDKLEEKEKRCWAERMVLAVNAAFPPSEYGTWSQCELLLPHALQAAQWSEMYQINRAEVGRLLQETASYLRSHARYKEAEPLYQRALRIWEQQGGPEHPDVAYSLRGLANLYRDQGKYADANLLYQRTLRIWERQGGPEHPETAAALYDVASFWEAQGNTQEALSLYQRALAIQEHTLGLDHPKTIATQQRVFSSLQEPGWHENVQS